MAVTLSYTGVIELHKIDVLLHPSLTPIHPPIPYLTFMTDTFLACEEKFLTSKMVI